MRSDSRSLIPCPRGGLPPKPQRSSADDWPHRRSRGWKLGDLAAGLTSSSPFLGIVLSRVVLQPVLGLVVVSPRAISCCDSRKARVEKSGHAWRSACTTSPARPCCVTKTSSDVGGWKTRPKLSTSSWGELAPVRGERRSAARDPEVSDFTVYAVILCFIGYKDKRSAGSGRTILHHTEAKTLNLFSVSSSLK